MCAMSSVTLSPAIGRLAVWLIAPCTNTARSVVPAPMSTSTTPSSRSSPVSTAVLDASDDRIRSSICRPQRCTHLLMLAAADCAHTRSEEHTSELQSLMRIPYAVFRLKKKTIRNQGIQQRQVDPLRQRENPDRL